MMLRSFTLISSLTIALARPCPAAETSAKQPDRDSSGIQNPLETWGFKDDITVFSHTGISYRAIVDVVHGGVISSLHVPGQGPNLVFDSHAPFRGFMNLFCMMLGKDEKTGKDKAVGRSTAWWLKSCSPIETKIVERSPDAVVIETTGSKPGMGTGEACVMKYKLRYTFLTNRILCDADAEWVYGHGTYLSESSLLHYLQPQACRYPAYAIGADGREIELPITSSGGTHLPDGVEFPFAIRVPLRNGLSMTFRLLEAPRAYRENRWYLFERPWQCDWGQVLGFTGLSKKEGNAFETPIAHTKHECVFSKEPLAAQNPIVEVMAPAGVEPAFRPGSHVTFAAIASQPDRTRIPGSNLQWEFFLNWDRPGGRFSGENVNFVIPQKDDKEKPVTAVWARVSTTGSNGRKGHGYGHIQVDEKTPYGVWGN